VTTKYRLSTGPTGLFAYFLGCSCPIDLWTNENKKTKLHLINRKKTRANTLSEGFEKNLLLTLKNSIP
jgi:hypothetical protein